MDLRVVATLRPATAAEVTAGLERNPGSARLADQGWTPAWFERGASVDGERSDVPGDAIELRIEPNL